MTRLLACALAVAVVALPSVPRLAYAAVSKEDIARAEAKALEAKFAFKAGKFETAAKLFLEAFAISRRPALIFNAARAWEEAGRLGEAKVAFEQYLELPDVSAAGKKDARARIAALEGRIAAADAKAAAEKAAADKAAAEKEAADKAAAEQAAADEAAKRKTASAASGEGNNAGDGASMQVATPAAGGRNAWVSYGLLGGGGVLILLSAVSWAGAVSRVEAANAMDFGQDDAVAKYNEEITASETARNGAVFFAAIGAGLAGWGAWRLWIADDAPARTALWGAPTLLPTATGTVSGLALGGRF